VEETFNRYRHQPHPTMKLTQLLHHRDALIRQARLANVAFAFHRLRDFAVRIDRARLTGVVTLHGGDPAAEQPWPRLVADEGRQSTIEEHFLDEDVIELADILAFLHDSDRLSELSFRIEDIALRYLPRLRQELELANVVVEREAPRPRDSNPQDG
jgi:hypothetical protein